MSALVAVCQANSIHLLTDGIAVSPNDGTVVAIRSKQIPIKNLVDGSTIAALAWSGWAPPAIEFAKRAQRACQSFDELFCAAPDIWKQVTAALPAPMVKFRFADGSPHQAPAVYNVVVGGLSESNGELVLFDLCNAYEPDGAQISVLASGGFPPVDAGDDPSVDFVNRFSAEPDTFDPITDGLDYMRTMRRQECQFSEGPLRHVVGGFVQSTILASSGEIWTGIIHRWRSDRVGAPIALE